MVDKLMYIHNDDTQNYPFFRLQLVVETSVTELNKTTNQNSIKDPKVVEPTNNKTFGASVINSPMYPPFWKYVIVLSRSLMLIVVVIA